MGMEMYGTAYRAYTVIHLMHMINLVDCRLLRNSVRTLSAHDKLEKSIQTSEVEELGAGKACRAINTLSCRRQRLLEPFRL